MSCKFTFKEKEYTSEESLIEDFKNDKDMLMKYSKRNPTSVMANNYTEESLDKFSQKISFLKEAMDVEVYLDPDTESSKVLAKNDPRTVAAGKPVILINPDQVFNTTAIHEFGHIFIDSIPGGLENPRLKRARKQLEGTQIESEVIELYPELTGGMLDKEIIATAMGINGSDIWDRRDSNAGTWNAIREWFASLISRTFGIEINAVNGLVREMLDTKLNKDYLETLSSQDQMQKAKRVSDEKTNTEKEIESLKKRLAKTYTQILSRVRNIEEQYRPKTKTERKKERQSKLFNELTGEKTNYERAKELVEKMEAFRDTEEHLGLIAYMDWALKEINFIDSTLKNRLSSTKAGQGSLSDDRVLKSLIWSNALSLVDDIQVLVDELDRKGVINSDQKAEYEAKTKLIQGERSEVENKLLAVAREIYAEHMAKADNKIKEQYILGYKEDYANGLAQEGETEAEYIKRKYNADKADIFIDAKNYFMERAQQSPGDIGSFAGKFMSEKEIDSADIQIISKELDRIEQVISKFALEKATEFDEMNKKLAEQKGGKKLSQEQKYEGMYVQSEGGRFYLRSRYKPEFAETNDELFKIARSAEESSEKYKNVELRRNKNNVVEYKDLDGNWRVLTLGVGKVLGPISDLDQVNVTYTRPGFSDEYSITIEQALAYSDHFYWRLQNTKNGLPTDEWLDPEFDKVKDDPILSFLKKEIMDSDERTDRGKSLISRSSGISFILLPTVLKTDRQRLVEGDFKGMVRRMLRDTTQVEEDDFETERGNASDSTKTNLENSVKVFADVNNREVLKVPIPFRGKLDNPNDQSLDLLTIVFMNTVASKNYQEKKEAEDTINIILEVMKNRAYPNTHGFKKMKKVNALSDESEEALLMNDPKEGLSNEALAAMSIVENRLYGIKNKDVGSITVFGKEMNVQQLTRSWLKYSGTVALVGNWVNSIVNATMGHTANFIEAVGGEHFNLKDLKVATKKYWSDSRGIMEDMGKNVPTSKTNRMMAFFNVYGNKMILGSNFENNVAGSLIDGNMLRPLANAGEHMMQAQTMYAVLSGIKVTNSKGKFINKEGKVVKTKAEAASLDEMLNFVDRKDGKGVQVVLDTSVGGTTFTPTGSNLDILTETRNLIKSKIIELHGNYDSDLQSAAQREFWGKLLFFLRKWMIPGYVRRWRGGLSSITKNWDELEDMDRYFSQDMKSDREGYYITGARFIIKTLVPAIRQMNKQLITSDWNKMGKHEKSNLVKMASEIAIISLTYALYAGFGDDDDPEKNIVARYLTKRMYSELTFFINPVESFKIASTPTASVGTAKRLLMFSAELLSFDWGDEYESGSNKGKNKLVTKGLKAIPVLSQVNRDLSDSLKFLNQLSF